ncbi:MAG TPA: CusA/CzcA family heavy metal efflux RND transporter [Candidatus Babeliales bacterium]|nr:CusA/CzcA family heavy metal efflux RND transporter [Candidatus Babeliales bacterium]
MYALIDFALKNRMLMVAFLVAVLIGGYVAFRDLNIEAYPDPVPPQVEIVTQATGIASEEIERDFTIPIETALAGIPNVTDIHSVSQFGMSDVHVQFTYAFSFQEALQRVLNDLGPSSLAPLPYGAQPGISPESSIGEIYRFRVVGPPGYSVMDLKTLMDWVLVRKFSAVPGIINVAGWGGKTKVYEADVDQNKMNAAGLSLSQILTVLGNSDVNVGGQTINLGMEGVAVRGVGLIRNLDDLSKSVVTSNNGTPIFLRDVADVNVNHLPRLGIAGQDNDPDIVMGIVLMGRGEKTLPAVEGVEALVNKINAGGVLPPGVHLQTIYDRRDLVKVTTDTVLHNLFFGIGLIFLIQWIFLGNLRSAVIVSLTIPFALSFAIIILRLSGESANLLSIGAVDFGLVVDSTVIIVENIFRRLTLAQAASVAQRVETVGDAGHQMTRSIFFAALIIIVSFIPLFTLGGIEGHIFGPMARTYAYAIAGGLIATFTVSPALCALLLGGHLAEEETPVVRFIKHVYRPLLDFTLLNPYLTLGCTAILLGIAYLAARQLGTEFLPHLEEGNFWIRATLPQSVSLEASLPEVNRMRRVMKSFPEVITVTSQHGRPDDGSDTGGPYNNEFYVPLKPRDEWPRGLTKDQLADEMSKALTDRFPGVAFGFSQNIEDNVEEAASGVKGENSVKVYGQDLRTDDKIASEIVRVMSGVRGITDLAAFHSMRQPTLNITVNREKAARYGLMTGDVNLVVQTAIGGTAAANNVYETGSDRNFPIIVRDAPQFRSTVDQIRRLTVNAPSPSGTGTFPVPLSDVADVKYVTGPSQIYRESHERYVPVKYSVRDRDLGGAVQDAEAQVAAKVQLPAGVHLEWVGELAEYRAAIKRLAIIVPLSLLLVLVLLYFNCESMRETLLTASVLPLTLVGGTLALFLTRTIFSVSAAIGFVALFGIAIMEGIIVVNTFNQHMREGMEKTQALRTTCDMRLRPVLMTCIAACVGLLPAAVSTGIGSQVQKPLAVVVVGGSFLAPILILLILPVLINLIPSKYAREVAQR